MKKLIYISTSILCLAVLFFLMTFKTGENIDQNALSTTEHITVSAKKEILPQKEQKAVFDAYIKRLSELREPSNLPSGNECREYYAYYDICNDGNLDLIEGYIFEDSNEIKARDIFGITDGKVYSWEFNLINIEHYTPLIYNNGIIRSGGKYINSVCEAYDYFKFPEKAHPHYVGGSYYIRLAHLLPPASLEEEWYVCYIDKNNNKTPEKLTKDEYDRLKSEVEGTPINSELEWHPFYEYY